MYWLLFQYNVPNSPSKLRVYVWRKLKAIRAEQLSEGFYALPLTEKTTEQLEWLCAEVKEMNGTAVLWKAECFLKKQEEELISRFQSRASEAYKKIQELLSQKPETGQQEWLENIIRQYADIRYHDYFDTQRKYTIHTQIEYHYKNRSERS